MASAPAYGPRLRHLERLRDRLEGVSARVANARLVALGVGVLLALLANHGTLPLFFYWPAAVAGVVFAGLVAWHDRVIRRLRLCEGVLRSMRDAEARLDPERSWIGQGPDGAQYKDAAHPYADDLDLFGRASLFQFLNVAVTERGQALLARWLLEAASPEDVARRQDAVRELAGLRALRHRLQAQSWISELEHMRIAGFVQWLDAPLWLKDRAWLLWSARLLVPLTWVLIVLRAGFGIDSHWWVALLAQTVVFAAAGKGLIESYEPVLTRHGSFAVLERVFALFERRRFQSEAMRAWQRSLMDGGELPSARMKTLRRIVDALHLRLNMLHPVINIFLLWDVFYVDRLERWKTRSGARVLGWLEALAELEALSSLARCAHDHPDWAFPELQPSEAPHFEAEALGHPLISPAQRISNSFETRGLGRVTLITGSNMSGKSTFLRTVGLGAVMAFAGAPVCAQRLRLSPSRLHSSMRIQDDLEHGVSHFYAEVRRLASVVAAARHSDDAPVLFLFDELLRGTNTRERLIASRAVIEEMSQINAFGLISTHDLALVELADAHPDQVVNAHFQELVEDGEMRFDYQLREGPVSSSNALMVMQLAGLNLNFDGG